MALAFGSSVAAAKTTGTNITSPSLTVTGTNPVIAIMIVYSSATITVSTLTWSLGGGTPVQITLFRGGGGTSDTVVIWVVPAPTAGAGTAAVTLSGSATNWRYVAAVFTGADQTTPAQNADSASINDPASSTTISALNLTANDATVFGCANNSGNISTVTNSLLIDNTTNTDTGIGYALGTASMTATYSDTVAHPNLAVRLIAAGGGPSAPTYPQLEGGIRGLARGVAGGIARSFVRKDRIFVPSYAVVGDLKAAA